MNIENPFYTRGAKIPSFPKERFSESFGRIHSHYLRGINEGLLYVLTQTPQRIDDILARQKAIMDILYHGANRFFSFEQAMDNLLREVNSNDMVKVWKTVKKDFGGTKEVPLVYDHRALHACVLKFQRLCSDIVTSLDSVESDLFLRVRHAISLFSNEESSVNKKWKKEKAFLDISEMPVFSFVQQDAWTHEIESILPFGAIVPKNMSDIINALRAYEQNPQGNLEIHIGDMCFTLQFVDATDLGIQLKRSGKTNPKRYLDRDLFLDIRGYVADVSDLIDELKPYSIGASFYRDLEKKKLPVCFPEPVDGNILEVRDFYPLHALFAKPSRYVCNSLKIDGDNPIAVVTGLNSGGKTSLLHSLHAILELSQAGFPVPAKHAVVGNFGSILHQEIVGGNMRDHTSTFRAQTRAALGFLDKHRDTNLSIGFLDEVLSGTDAETGSKAITEFLQILAQVIKKPTVIVTHCTPAATDVEKNPDKYPGVKLYCFRRDAKNKPTFKLEPGIGLSEGEYILAEEGLSLAAFKKRKKIKRKTSHSGKKHDEDDGIDYEELYK